MLVQPFRVESDVDGEVHAFSVAGELDQATAQELRRPLLDAVEAGARAVLIDLADCQFIDSTGLSVLVEARRFLVEREQDPGRLTICCPDLQVRRLLEITGLDQAIEVFGLREEALAALARK